MHIITRKRLNLFAAKHPTAKPGLVHWYRTLKPATVRSFVELRALFPSADQVGKLTVFNISGNTARLIAAVHFATVQKIRSPSAVLRAGRWVSGN